MRQQLQPEIESDVRACACDAISRLVLEARRFAPSLGERVANWVAQLGGSGHPEDYFTHPLSAPALLLPWWIELRACGSVDAVLQSDLTYSTISGYCFIRIVDDAMDGHPAADSKLLPALAFFHTQFQTTYARHFSPDDPFWDFFRRVWFAGADAVHRDKLTVEFTEREFVEVAAQKSAAVKIPMAAVCYRHSRTDLLAAWAEFYDVFACWHQMIDDILDWHDDLRIHNHTYLLSEGERRKRADEPFVHWLYREGFSWACDVLRVWMLRMKSLGADLGSPELISYLEERDTYTRECLERFARGLHALGILSDPQMRAAVSSSRMEPQSLRG